jgi:hypothetical protein
MGIYKNIIWALALAIFFSCDHSKDRYLQKWEMANKEALPKDSLACYFSTFDPVDSSQLDFLRSSFLQDWLAASLYAFKEPVLYNGYLGSDRYRFLWLPSFHKPMVFTIVNDSGRVFLNVKKLDRHPLNRDVRYINGTSWDLDYIGMGHEIIKETDTLKNGETVIMSKIRGRYAKIIYNATKELTKDDWNQFESLLGKAGFWNLTPYVASGATDGAEWVIEANTRRGYRYVIREMIEENLMDAGNLLVKLSGLEIELY